ncbi:mRNA splicing factor, Cwf18 family protein, partial [Reticulomyxa filosa]
EAHHVKNLQQEIRVLKKRLKLAMADLDKQRNYYLAQLQRLKDHQDRWIRLQKDALKNKQAIVKYIFLDDVHTMKVYPKRKQPRHKVRIETERGEKVVVHISDVKVYNEGDQIDDEEDDDDNINTNNTNNNDNNNNDNIIIKKEEEMKDDGNVVDTTLQPTAEQGKELDKENDIDTFLEEMEKELKQEPANSNESTKEGKKERVFFFCYYRPRKKKVCTICQYICICMCGFTLQEQTQSSLKLIENDESEFEMEEDDDNDNQEEVKNLQKQIDRLLTELHYRTSDLQAIQNIYIGEPLENHATYFKELLDQVQHRHHEFVNLMEQYAFDVDELKEATKTWEEAIDKVRQAVAESMATELQKKGNGADEKEKEHEKTETTTAFSFDEAIVHTSTTTKDGLSAHCKQCIEELNGRIYDLMILNDIYFHPGCVDLFTTEHDPMPKDLGREERVEELKHVMRNRHRGEQEALELMEVAPDDDFVDQFVGSNNAWRDLIYVVQVEFETSETQAEQYVFCLSMIVKDELQQRTKDLEGIVKVVRGDESNEVLEQMQEAI